MKAFVLTAFDVPPELIDLPAPVPGPGEILIRVHATSVNPVDELVRAGFFRTVQDYRFPAIFGRDVSGVVEQLGEGVTQHAVGDAVYGFVKRPHIGDGTFAEYVVIPQDQFVGPTPTGCSLVAAGTLGLSGVTALECVEAVPSGPGSLILVNGATGGVGSFAVQIAAAAGAEVIATARSAAQADLVRSLGAKHVVDWSAGDLVEQVRSLSPDGIDGFVDVARYAAPVAIGVGEEAKHEAFARRCRDLLRSGGAASSTTNGGDPALLHGITFTNVHSTPAPPSIARLTALVDAGVVVAPIQATFDFDEIAAAFDRLLAGPSLGKISVVLPARRAS